MTHGSPTRKPLKIKYSKTALWPQNFLRLRRAKRGFALAPPGIGYPGRHHHTRRPGPLVGTPGNRSGVREQRDDLSRHSDKPIRIRQPDALDSMVWIVGPRLHARDGAQEAGHGLDVAGPSTRAEGARGGARAGRRADGGPSMERRRRRRGSLEANTHQRQRMLCQQCIVSGVRVARERGRRRHGTCIALTLERQGRRRAGCTRTRADTREHVHLTLVALAKAGWAGGSSRSRELGRAIARSTVNEDDGHELSPSRPNRCRGESKRE